jgi:hypothetical protein
MFSYESIGRRMIACVLGGSVPDQMLPFKLASDKMWGQGPLPLNGPHFSTETLHFRSQTVMISTY